MLANLLGRPDGLINEVVLGANEASIIFSLMQKNKNVNRHKSNRYRQYIYNVFNSLKNVCL